MRQKTQLGGDTRASANKVLRMLVLMTTFISLARAENEGKIIHFLIYSFQSLISRVFLINSGAAPRSQTQK